MIPKREGRVRPSAEAAGFTLLEVMVALVVVGVLLTGVLHAFAQGIRAQARMQNVTIAALVASEEALETFTNPMDKPPPGSSDEFTPPPPHDYFYGTRTVEQHELLPNLNQITISVSWETGLGDRRRSREETNASQSLEICFLEAQM